MAGRDANQGRPAIFAELYKQIRENASLSRMDEMYEAQSSLDLDEFAGSLSAKQLADIEREEASERIDAANENAYHQQELKFDLPYIEEQYKLARAGLKGRKGSAAAGRLEKAFANFIYVAQDISLFGFILKPTAERLICLRVRIEKGDDAELKEKYLPLINQAIDRIWNYV
jgi:hypothetical protein